MSHGTRGGRVADYTEAWEQEEAKLYDFGINSAQLGEAHRRWLSNRVVPILVRGGSITVVGEASRTGSFRHNDALSLRRAKAVLAYLRSAVPASFAQTMVCSPEDAKGIGEFAAIQDQQDEGTENSFYRAVRVNAWMKPTPPPEPKPRPKPQPKPRHLPFPLITHREWRGGSVRLPKYTGGGGGKGFTAGEAAARRLFDDLDEVRDKRRQTTFPDGYVVNSVLIEEISDKDVRWKSWYTKYTWSYGPARDSVKIVTKRYKGSVHAHTPKGSSEKHMKRTKIQKQKALHILIYADEKLKKGFIEKVEDLF